jgi:hypothetical protein
MPADIPNTAPYLYLGLAAITTIMSVFIGSLIVRYRNLRRDLQQIEAYAEEERS